MKKLNRELISSSYCLSLGCYSALEVGKLIGSQASPDNIDSIFANLLQSLPSSWPQKGGLHLNISYAGAWKSLPLSPPIVVSFIILGDQGQLLTSLITDHRRWFSRHIGVHCFGEEHITNTTR